MATSTLGNGTLVLAGTTSGTTTVTATAVAGTTTLTLPAATDTLVGKATTDTLTNKTLTGAVMNGTLGATTPSTVAATTLTTSSTVTHNGGTANGVAYLDGSKVLTTGSALVFDGTNLGLGVTPSAWQVNNRAIQLLEGYASISSNNSQGCCDVASNCFNAGSAATSGWKYTNTGVAVSLFQQQAGAFKFLTAASGTAGNAITFTQAMTLDASGGLQTLNTIGVGNATPSTSGAGITFPATQSASTNANTLDDYEEGTWTPTIVRESTALGAVTYTAQDGKYTKIGRVVYITCSVAWSNIASAGAGANRIDGLPFSSGVSQTNGGATFYSSDGIATNPVLAGLFYNSTIYLRKSANILAVSNLNEAYNNSGTFSFNGYYFV